MAVMLWNFNYFLLRFSSFFLFWREKMKSISSRNSEQYSTKDNGPVVSFDVNVSFEWRPRRESYAQTFAATFYNWFSWKENAVESSLEWTVAVAAAAAPDREGTSDDCCCQLCSRRWHEQQRLISSTRTRDLCGSVLSVEKTAVGDGFCTSNWTLPRSPLNALRILKALRAPRAMR